MPLTYSIDPTQRMIRAELGERVPPITEIRRVFDEIAADPLFRPGWVVLIEGGGLYIGRTVERRALVLLSARLALNFGVLGWAFLTHNVGTYRERQFEEAYAQRLGIAYRVFTSRIAAMSWLRSLRGEPGSD